MSNGKFTWAGRMGSTPGALEALGNARLVRGVEAALAQAQGEIWVRGQRLETRDETAVREIPWREFYEILDDGALRPRGRRLPGGRLPPVEWKAIKDFLQPQMPPSSLAGCHPGKINIRLRRENTRREPVLLLATEADWFAFGDRASEIRLHPLIWAHDGSTGGAVFVRGSPLPPLPGEYFVERDGVAVPAGFAWSPGVSPENLRRALGIPAGELAVLRFAEPRDADDSGEQECTCTPIPRTAWLPGKRSMIRLVAGRQQTNTAWTPRI